MSVSEIQKCHHCKGDVAIRNPSGFCDHLYYPDNCKVCRMREKPADVISDLLFRAAWTARKYLDPRSLIEGERPPMIQDVLKILDEAIAEAEKEPTND